MYPIPPVLLQELLVDNFLFQLGLEPSYFASPWSSYFLHAPYQLW